MIAHYLIDRLVQHPFDHVVRHLQLQTVTADMTTLQSDEGGNQGPILGVPCTLNAVQIDGQTVEGAFRVAIACFFLFNYIKILIANI